MFDNKKVLITGGTGTFGKMFIEKILKTKCKKIYVFSRDELKQHELKVIYGQNNPRISFLIGNIRDKDRLYRSFEDIDIVIHAAALKQVPSCEYNPFEAVKTNIIGAQNIVDAAIDCKVKKVLALSTDKAVAPVNLYGATKMCQEKIFISGNSYVGNNSTIFSCVRYGNVLGSRGSVYHIFKKAIEIGVKIPITDNRMTRFFLLPSDAVQFVFNSLNNMLGGEIFIPKLNSIKITDLALSMINKFSKNKDVCYGIEEVGCRYGEKIHETLISNDEARNVIKFGDYMFVVMPNFEWFNYEPCYCDKNGLVSSFVKVDDNFSYSSNNNDSWIDQNLMSGYIERIENGKF